MAHFQHKANFICNTVIHFKSKFAIHFYFCNITSDNNTIIDNQVTTDNNLIDDNPMITDNNN